VVVRYPRDDLARGVAEKQGLTAEGGINAIILSAGIGILLTNLFIWGISFDGFERVCHSLEGGSPFFSSAPATGEILPVEPIKQRREKRLQIEIPG
jgi:hypothetical protein